ncbi:hypothetical protein HDE_06875 [Halotydeus destructor]|nr:hypothetical protein HDE_06875 [Halotydeus destructor]
MTTIEELFEQFENENESFEDCALPMADEVAVYSLAKLFTKVDRRNMSSPWQCVICGDVLEYRKRLEHATTLHGRGWRQNGRKSNSSLFRTIEPHLRNPTAFYEKKRDSTNRFVSVKCVLEPFEVEESPLRRVREYPIRHPAEAFITTSGQLLKDKDFAEGSYRCRVCGRECSYRSMGYHVANAHPRGWREEAARAIDEGDRKSKSKLVGCKFEFQNIPEMMRIPTGFYCDPGQPIPAAIDCKWQTLLYWESSVLEEPVPLVDGLEEDIQPVVFTDQLNTDGKHYKYAFGTITGSHPWRSLADGAGKNKLCLICGYFVQVNHRRAHMISCHEHIWQLRDFRCPHPTCRNETESFYLTTNWANHVYNVHQGFDPRQVAIESIPTDQRIKWAYFSWRVKPYSCDYRVDLPAADYSNSSCDYPTTISSSDDASRPKKRLDSKKTAK